MRIRKYIYSLLIGRILVATLILASIFWTTKALRLLDTIAIKGVNLIDFAKLSACLLPYIVYLILPLSTLVSFAIVYRVLDQDNELLVLKMSGIRKSKLVAPFLEVCAIFVMVGLFISVFLIPISYQKFQKIILNYQNYYLSTFIEEKSFNSEISGLTFYINKKDGDVFEGIFINDHRSAHKEISIFAERGELKTDGLKPVFTLYNGMQFERSVGSNGDSSANNIASNLKFEVYNLVFDYKKALQTINRVEHQELKVSQLLSSAAFARGDAVLITEGFRRLLWPCLSLFLPLIFLSVAINAKFSRRFRYLPVILSFLFPFFFILLNVYAIGYALKMWNIMIFVIIFDLLIALISYLVACNPKMSFKI